MSIEINNSIAILFKATRRFHRLQQTEFATILGVTQGTISKIEAASMSPELGLWFKFLKAFNIQDPYCFTYYGIEFNDSAFANLKTEGSSLAPSFDFQSGNFIFNSSKLRPLYDLLVQNHSKILDSFLKDNKIGKEIFFILNHPITFEFADNFFSFLQNMKINAKSVSLLDLNFEHALGRQMKELSNPSNIFNVLNNEDDAFLDYELSDSKGEYFINLKENNPLELKLLESSDLIMNYNLLYPFHVMKSAKTIMGVNPVIHEIKKDHRWQVTYAS